MARSQKSSAKGSLTRRPINNHYDFEYEFSEESYRTKSTKQIKPR